MKLNLLNLIPFSMGHLNLHLRELKVVLLKSNCTSLQNKYTLLLFIYIPQLNKSNIIKKWMPHTFKNVLYFLAEFHVFICTWFIKLFYKRSTYGKFMNLKNEYLCKNLTVSSFDACLNYTCNPTPYSTSSLIMIHIMLHRL
jgi:hypothetical protein